MIENRCRYQSTLDGTCFSRLIRRLASLVEVWTCDWRSIDRLLWHNYMLFGRNKTGIQISQTLRALLYNKFIRCFMRPRLDDESLPALESMHATRRFENKK